LPVLLFISGFFIYSTLAAWLATFAGLVRRLVAGPSRGAAPELSFPGPP
jgi:hypothetical protein